MIEVCFRGVPAGKWITEVIERGGKTSLADAKNEEASKSIQ